MKSLTSKEELSFGKGVDKKKKYHLLRWEIINKSKKYSGLGIKNIHRMNVSLLCKWWWKLEAENGIWQQIVTKKYMSRDTVGSVRHKIDDSSIWSDLLKVKSIYLKCPLIRGD